MKAEMVQRFLEQVITDSVLERHFNDALMIVKGMSVLREVSGIIRVYGD